MHQASQLKDAEKRAHILSERQSTFLSGLFSTKSPWDTQKTIWMDSEIEFTSENGAQWDR